MLRAAFLLLLTAGCAGDRLLERPQVSMRDPAGARIVERRGLDTPFPDSARTGC
jgi:hypothetical protein